MMIFDDIFWATIFSFKCECFCLQISPNIFKYHEISLNSNTKLFENYRQKSSGFTVNTITQPVITCSKLTIETLKQGVKYVQS